MTTQQRRRRQNVRVEDRGGKVRYWDPKDGMWTRPLQGHPSMERYYALKGMVRRPPGKLAYYVNPAMTEFESPNLKEQAQVRAQGVAGPLPTGDKATTCRCPQNCDSWEEHYQKRNLIFDHSEEEHTTVEGSLTGEQMQQMTEYLLSLGWQAPGATNVAPAEPDSEAFTTEGDGLFPDEEEAQPKPGKSSR